MSTPVDCCNPCQTVPPVNIPGTPGAQGPAGADGINAFTLTTADFVVPAIGGSVTVLVANSSWATIGQNVFIQGAGTFIVTAKPGTGSMTLTYLNYQENTNTGNTVSTGAEVSPGGLQPTLTLLPAVTTYGLGGSQVLNLVSSQLLGLSIVLGTGTYLIFATCRVDFVSATTVASLTLALKLRETANGPADIANAKVNAATGIVSNAQNTLFDGSVPPVVYSATAGDTIKLFGSLNGTPYTGNIEAIEASLVAIKLF